MGIRVHKVIGYGVTNLKFKEEGGRRAMTDPRIDWTKWQSLQEDRYATTVPQFLAWVLEHKAEILELHAKEDPRKGSSLSDADVVWEVEMTKRLMDQPGFLHSPADCVIHTMEGGDPGVLLFVPPASYPSWHRRDDTMDWIEETQCYGQKMRVRRIPDSGIFPYNGFWIRHRKPGQCFLAKPDEPPPPMDRVGNCFDDWGPTRLHDETYAILTGRQGIRGWSRADSKCPVAKGGLLRHLKQDFRPPVPLGVIALILWLGCVKNPAKLIDQLRPLLYVYWC